MALSLTTLQSTPLTPEMHESLLLMAVVCNLNEQVAIILDVRADARDKHTIELIKLVDSHPEIVEQLYSDPSIHKVAPAVSTSIALPERIPVPAPSTPPRVQDAFSPEVTILGVKVNLSRLWQAMRHLWGARK